MIPVSVTRKERTAENIKTKALIDSGAGGTFINKKFVQKHQIEQIPLLQPIKVFNVDGTPNKVGKITHCALIPVQIGERQMNEQMMITGLGKEDIILGLPWLKRHNPQINWDKGQMNMKQPTQISKVLRNALEITRIQKITIPTINPETSINAVTTAVNRHKPTPMIEIPTIKDIETLIKEIKELTPIKVTQTVGKKPTKRPLHMSMEEVPDETQEGKPRNTPLENWQPLLLRVDGMDKEDDINLLKTYLEKDEDLYTEEDTTWIRTKTTKAQEFAKQAEEREAKPKVTLPEFYQEYASVFDKKTSERMPTRKPWDHAIDLKEDFIPKDTKIYPMSPGEQEKLNEFLEENLRKGYIRQSKSPQASPFFFVSKKDSTKLRPTQDYRKLNDGTIKNSYPLPLVSDLLDKLKGAKYFTKLDLRWGYNNVRIKEGNEWKAAFKTNRGLFEPLVMFFGLCNSPSTFQNMMNDIFVIELKDGWILMYIDDILIFSDNLDDLRQKTLQVLQKLKENDLYLNLDKCAFEAKEVDYLGMVIRENEIAMEPTKLAGIADWPVPTTVKQV